MLQEYINKYPEWTQDNISKYGLCLSNDIDSLLSCIILKQIKGYDIETFFDFNTIYLGENKENNLIGVDLAITKGKTWDNHVSTLSQYDKINPKMANINIVEGITRDNYFHKYCGSTLLQIWSFYNLPLPKKGECLAVLLGIDSTFKGFYSYYENDRNAHQKYVGDIFRFNQLIELEKKHPQKDFYSIINKFNLSGKIWIDENGILETNINLPALSEVFLFPVELPKVKFTPYIRLKNKTCNLNPSRTDYKKNGQFSLALTGKNFISYSEIQHIN